MSEKPTYDLGRADFAAVTRETTGWTAIIVGVIAVLVVAGGGYVLYWDNVVRPAEIAAQRQQDVQSLQNVVGQRTAIDQFIADYNVQAGTLAHLQGSNDANAPAERAVALAAMQADVNAVHDDADNLPDMSVLPASQQQFLKDHPRP